jgi:membrane protease YdiL (CAAX protease family)
MAVPMENQTTTPAVPQRAHFHITLGLILFPPAALFVGWTLAIMDVLRGYDTKEQLRWTRWLVALVVADALVAGSLGWMIAEPDKFKAPPDAVAPANGPRVGVQFTTDGGKETTRIQTIVPGSPAEQAGLKLGDVVEKVDAAATPSAKEFRDAILAGAAGTPRELTVRRGDEVLTMSVTPVIPPKSSLFETGPATRDDFDWAETIVQFLPALLVVAIAALVARRRSRMRLAVWRGFMLASLGSFAISIGVGFLVRAILGGWSLGGGLIAMVMQMLGMLGLTLVATRWCGRDVPPPDDPLPPLPPVRTGLLGAYYLFTGFIRASVLLGMADILFFDREFSSKTQVLDLVARSPLGVLGTMLFVLDVVFLGPFAEEKLFRGYLLPRLAAQWGVRASMVFSSAIFALFHPHYGLFMLFVFLYGYIFAWARLRSGTIVVPWVLHMLVNGLVSLFMLTKS